jgi:peptidoglycan/LPS O-acetylase OafA/YrhL
VASARARIVVLMGLGKVLGTSLSVPLILAVAAPMIGFVGWIGYRWMEQPSIRLGRTVEVCFARCCSARL